VEAAMDVRVDVSVVIPTYDRGAALAETLAALGGCDYAADRWEAIVVDDGSNEDIAAIVVREAERSGVRLSCLRQENSGPAAARNRGASEARGKFLIFIDNDIIVERDFLRRHIEALRAHPGCWVVGRVVHPPELRRTPFGRYRDALWEAFNDAAGGRGIVETGGITAANLSLPAADFARFGGFDERFTIASCEDWELGMRARKAGVKVMYDPEIVALHNDWAVSLERFCERQRLYSISDVLLWREYGEASPRARMVRENGPVDWGSDGVRLIAKKAAKKLLAARPGLVRWMCRLTERVMPDSRWNRRVYDAAVATAIFAGVREGLRRSDHTTLEQKKLRNERNSRN
jgi:GT2 family glycosyltransferase